MQEAVGTHGKGMCQGDIWVISCRCYSCNYFMFSSFCRICIYLIFTIKSIVSIPFLIIYKETVFDQDHTRLQSNGNRGGRACRITYREHGLGFLLFGPLSEELRNYLKKSTHLLLLEYLWWGSLWKICVLVLCSIWVCVVFIRTKKKKIFASGIEPYKGLWEPLPLGLSIRVTIRMRKINLITRINLGNWPWAAWDIGTYSDNEQKSLTPRF